MGTEFQITGKQLPARDKRHIHTVIFLTGNLAWKNTVPAKNQIQKCFFMQRFFCEREK